MNQNPSGPSKSGNGHKFSQNLVNQEPVYDRDYKKDRPPKKKKKGPKWL